LAVVVHLLLMHEVMTEVLLFLIILLLQVAVAAVVILIQMTLVKMMENLAVQVVVLVADMQDLELQDKDMLVELVILP
jgi:hypothetical protein